jgi:peptidoglycan/LPS O-acetylase OafA/YrhL
VTSLINHQNKRYLFLDGFRGIAVLWILLHHLFVFIYLKPVLGGLFDPLAKIAFVGQFGVDMFFVISGFLITGLLIKEMDAGKVDVKRFYCRRFFKIVPQYLLAVNIGMVITFIFNIPRFDGVVELNPINYWRYFIFIQNYAPLAQMSILAHTWTISVEEQFYFVFPLLLLLICAGVPKSQYRRKVLMLICILLIIIGNGWRYIFLNFIPHQSFAYQETHFHFDGLVLGILIKLSESYLSKIRGVAKHAVSLACFTVGVLIYLRFILNGVRIEDWPTLGLAYLAPGLIIISALMDFNPVQYFAENSALRWVGRMSYGIYLWHYIVLFLILPYVHQLGKSTASIAYLSMAIFAGFLSTVTIERYFLSLRDKYIP